MQFHYRKRIHYSTLGYSVNKIKQFKCKYQRNHYKLALVRKWDTHLSRALGLLPGLQAEPSHLHVEVLFKTSRLPAIVSKRCDVPYVSKRIFLYSKLIRHTYLQTIAQLVKRLHWVNMETDYYYRGLNIINLFLFKQFKNFSRPTTYFSVQTLISPFFGTCEIHSHS